MTCDIAKSTGQTEHLLTFGAWEVFHFVPGLRTQTSIIGISSCSPPSTLDSEICANKSVGAECKDICFRPIKPGDGGKILHSDLLIYFAFSCYLDLIYRQGKAITACKYKDSRIIINTALLNNNTLLDIDFSLYGFRKIYTSHFVCKRFWGRLHHFIICFFANLNDVYEELLFYLCSAHDLWIIGYSSPGSSSSACEYVKCINITIIYTNTFGYTVCSSFYFFTLQSKGCVWAQSTEADLWDEWTDIRCNDGHQLMDR